MQDNQNCIKFLVDIGVKASEITDITNSSLKCDYIGLDNENWHIVEHKASKADMERGVMQLYRYYDELRYSKYNSDNTTNNTYQQFRIKPAWNGKELTHEQLNKCEPKTYHNAYGKHEIKLYLLFNGTDIDGFKRYYSIYKFYIERKNNPKIEFWYINEEDKPQRLGKRAKTI